MGEMRLRERHQRVADLERTVVQQADAMALLRTTIDSLRIENARLILQAHTARAFMNQVAPSNGLTEDIITQGRIYTMLRLSHTFSGIFLDQIALNADDPQSLMPAQPNVMQYNYGQMVYSTTYLSILAAVILRETCVDVDHAREVMMDAFDKADNFIVTVEDLAGSILAFGEDYEYGDDEDDAPDDYAEEPGAST